MQCSFQNVKQKKKKDKENILQDEVNKAKQTCECYPTNKNASDFNRAKERLEHFYHEKLQGIIIRALARWCEHGEKSTKCFLTLEKRNHVKKHVRKWKINGSITLIRSRFFLRKNISIKNYIQVRIWVTSKQLHFFFNSLNIPRRKDEQKFSCEGSITEEECVKALQSFQGNKAPGNDRLPIEFYGKFWEIMSEPFVNCVNEIFISGEMSRSQKQAVITLIEKKGKEPSLLENWRPISLVNVDAKIIS